MRLLPGVVCAAFCSVSFAQEVTFRSDVNLVSIAVRVTDADGRDVRGLNASDFAVREDGHARRISFFAAEEQPLSLAVLLDNSTSMRASGKRDQAREALSALFTSAPSGSQLFFGEFSSGVESFSEVSRKGATSGRLLESKQERGGTALYDSISTALCLLRGARYPRQVLVVVTDGADQHSRLRLAELIEAAQSTRAQVFVIACLDPFELSRYKRSGKTIVLESGREIDNPVHVFDKLTSETGAQVFYPVAEDLPRAVAAVRDALRTQYTLAYYLDSDSKQYRSLDVRVGRKGLNVRARRGFSLPEDMPQADAVACAISASAHPYPYEARLNADHGRLIYREDFRDPATGWPNHNGSFYRGGAYHIERVNRSAPKLPSRSTTDFTSSVASLPPAGEATMAAYGPWFSSVRATVSISMHGEPGSRIPAAAGLVFRMNDRGYYAVVLAKDRRSFKLTRTLYSSGTKDLLDWQPVPTLAFRSGDAQLTAECEGKRLTIAINGVVAARLDDGTLEDGLVGMILAGDGTATFRDLEATGN